MDFFANIFCKTNKNTLSQLPAQKMVNTLPSSVASWRSKKYIQENPEACETFGFVLFQFPWHYYRSYCFPKWLSIFTGFFWPVILYNPRPNRKCFGVKNSSFLTPWTKSDAYVSINLIFFAKTVCLLCFNKFSRYKTTDNGGILSSFISSAIVDVQFNGRKILQ